MLKLTLLLAVASAQPGLESLAAPARLAQPAADFFVSPQGRDTWSGTRPEPGEPDGPFATATRAREAVRKLLKAQREPRPIRVILRGGIYFLDTPLEFGPEDSGTPQSPVTYLAAPGEQATLSGGRRLGPGRWGEIRGRKAWMVSVPEATNAGVEGRGSTVEGRTPKVGVSQPGSRPSALDFRPAWRFRQLFVNDERRPRTRLPKQGEYRIESLPGYGGDFLRHRTKQFIYATGHIQADWHHLADVDVVGITRWLDNRLPIASVDASTRTVTFDRPSLFALLSGNEPGPYWIENVFEALEDPGQWYLDRSSGLLSYLPRPGEENPEFIAPRLSQLLRVVGNVGAHVHDLYFEGLTFAHTEWEPPPDYASSLQAGIEVPGALFFDYAERCAIADCRLQHLGNYGIEVGVGCTDLAITRNQITDIGAGGVRIGHFFSWETDGNGRLTERGLQRKAAMPSGPHSRRITVADNEISHGGRVTPEAVGVFVGDNAENQVLHNHIHDLFYSGISVGSVQDFGPSQARSNVVEYNHVHDVGQGMLSDLAGIYTCSTPDSRIAGNLVHHVSRRDYGGWGIYTDEGSHDLLIRNNMIHHCQDGALFVHHSRQIKAENNIFALNRITQVDRGGIGGLELLCARNIFYYQDGTAVGDYGSAQVGRERCAFDRNLYWNASGQPVRLARKTFAEWQSLNQDTNGQIADPRFVDPAAGNFTLRPGSPAVALGFEPWDLTRVGPRRDKVRRSSEVPSSR